MDKKSLGTIKSNFLKELQLASIGEKTSLAFLIHQIPSSSLVTEGDTFQVIVIGGSICRTSLVQKKEDTLVVLKKDKISLPLFDTKKDLFAFITEQLDPKAQILALNFAYPLIPVFEKGRLDGILASGTKEHQFKGLIGQRVADEVEKYVYKNLKRKITVSCANDTICLALSGLTQIPPEKLAAGIVGTGTNFAFFLDKVRLVNLESGNFDKFTQSPEVKIVDRQSNSPGKYLYEKEVAGAYLYKIFNSEIKRRKIPAQVLDSTQKLTLVSRGKSEAAKLAAEILERSASLVVGQITAITSFKNQNLNFVMEGGLFWDKNYQTYIKKYTKLLPIPYKIKFVKIQNSSILGAAKLVA